METIVIAGGSGMIGTAMAHFWRKAGHTVRILSRKPTNLAADLFHWNPTMQVIDESALKGCTVLINLSGEGIAESRWTKKRKQVLYASRIQTTEFLFSKLDQMPELKHFLCASGINAYGFDDGRILHTETDTFGNDFTSQLVKAWEETAGIFSGHCKVTSVRIGIVLSNKGGALPKLMTPVKMGIGSPIGSGKQMIPWITLEDLVRVFDHLMREQKDGIYNANAGNTTNSELTSIIASRLQKKLWMPKVPGIALYLLFGEMSELLLKGVSGDNGKLLNSGFEFDCSELENAVKCELKK